MDENLEKKPKRPRIGEVRPMMDENEANAPQQENIDYNRETHDGENAGTDHHEGGYQASQHESQGWPFSNLELFPTPDKEDWKSHLKHKPHYLHPRE